MAVRIDHQRKWNMRSRHHSDTFNLDVCSQWQLLGRNTSMTDISTEQATYEKGYSRPTGLLLAKVLGVNLVHCREVLHVTEEDVDLHHVLDRSAGCFEHVRQVLDALVLWRMS